MDWSVWRLSRLKPYELESLKEIVDTRADFVSDEYNEDWHFA